MTFLALYLACWSTTVNSMSRLGLATAYSAKRRTTWMVPNTISTGENAMARKASTMTTGLISRPVVTPKRLMMRPVPKSWISTAIELVARSMVAYAWVRAALEANSWLMRSPSWKYMTVEIQVISSRNSAIISR